MKKVVWLVLQSLLLLICSIVGSFLRPFHIQKITAITPGITHIFVWDGFLLMLLVYVLIVLVEALTKHIRTAFPLTTLALAIAAVLSVAMKLGHITREL
ncbi:hypothetical protein [Granulicella sp. dw_53]|uniref:hypothetical protein n=1 Tax=Granulicella sp. dw_53 TaxID=2719792 RepID=UPI001BD4BA71|nr:hypothetical protein [Granulicella sp. dw_53]